VVNTGISVSERMEICGKYDRITMYVSPRKIEKTFRVLTKINTFRISYEHSST
jgi:hypothetical protein